MSTHTQMFLAMGLSLASFGVLASGRVAFENNSFLMRQGAGQEGNQCLAGVGLQLKLVECPTPEKPNQQYAIINSLLTYRNGEVMLAENAGSYELEMCLTNDPAGLSFAICNDQSTQKFAVAISDHITGSYAITQGQKCVTHASGSTVQMEDCFPGDDRQKYTPRLMTDAIQYKFVNENHGHQDVWLSFQEQTGGVIWTDLLWNIKRGQPQTRLVVDFNSYGINGLFRAENPLYAPLSSLDRAGDVTTITMPRQGEKMERTTDSPTVPTMVSNAGALNSSPYPDHSFRIFGEVADMGFHREEKIRSFSTPEGWILNVYEKSNFEGTSKMITSTSSGTYFPQNIGSIDVIQKAGSPIRLRNHDGKDYRPGEIMVGSDFVLHATPRFYRDGQVIGPKDKSSLGALGNIYSYINGNPPEGEKNGFYILKQVDSTWPFEDRSVWEPLNVGSWHTNGGRKDELYANYHSADNTTAIWKLRKDGPLTCIPANGVFDDSWAYLGSMKGEFNTVNVNNTGEGLYIYEGRDYKGERLKITQDIADLCVFNDRMRSFTIPPGWKVRFFTGKDFTGKYYTRTGSQSYQHVLDRTIKSIKILRKYSPIR